MNKSLCLLLCSFVLVGCNETSSSSGDSVSRDGTGGSTARFTLVDDYLYTISGNSLQLFDITSPESPNTWTSVYLDWDIETLFPYKDHLLVGSQTGVHILDNSDPSAPVYVTEFSHAQSCDPVVAENDIAYVTLRDGTSCRTDSTNQLDVLDISDMSAPKLIKPYTMSNPKGLAIDGDYLFVCDGRGAGLRVFDVTDPLDLEQVEILRNIDCFDVIAKDQTLYVSATNDLYQFNYSSFPMTQISQLNAYDPDGSTN